MDDPPPVEALAGMVRRGFEVTEVTSTRDHVAVRLHRGSTVETVTLDAEAAREVLRSPPPPEAPRPPDVEARDGLVTLEGLIADGFQVTDVASQGDRLTVTLRCGEARETVTLGPRASRAAACRLLDAVDEGRGGLDDPAAPDREMSSRDGRPDARPPST